MASQIMELFSTEELTLNASEIVSKAKLIFSELESLDEYQKIAAINELKKSLHDISPMRHEPVDCVLWVPGESVYANGWNPNSVATPEMQLLELSITSDGYTQPIVTFQEDSGREVVDGFHRNRVGKECKAVRDRVMGYLPVVTINDARTDKGDRMAATIRHNRARGKHKIEGMSDIVVELRKRNWNDEKIGRELGMDPDEVLRLSQISGLAEMFADKEFSEAWEAEGVTAINEDDNLVDEDEINEGEGGSIEAVGIGDRESVSH